MEEQLPTPLTEFFVLHLYLSSITLLAGIIILYPIMKYFGKYSGSNYVLNSLFLLISSVIFSFLLWFKWPFDIDFMFGPFNLPTTLILLLYLGIYVVMTKAKSIKKETPT